MNIVWTNWKLVRLWGKGFLSIPVLLLVFLVAFGVRDGFLSFLFILAVAHPFSGVHSYVGAKSFSYCLPGYRGMLRKMVLTDAVLGGFVCGVFGALLPGDWIRPLVGLNALTGFFVGFAFALLTATLTLIPFVMAPAMDVLLSIPFGIAFLVAVGAVVLCNWLIWPIVILMSIAVSILAWARLCDAEDVTHAHRTLVDRLRKKRAKMGTAQVSAPWVDELFLGRMIGPGFLRVGRWFWGSLYRTFGLILSAWKGILIAIVGSTVVLGYTSQWQAFIALGLATSVVKLPIMSSMLLPEGRSEKRRAAVGAAVATIALLVSAASLVVALSWCLAPFMPQVLGREYVGISHRNIYLPSIVVPWMFLLQLLRYGAQNRVLKGVLRVTAVLMILIAFNDPQVWSRVGITHPTVFGAVFVSGGVFFLLMLRRVFMRGLLVR